MNRTISSDTLHRRSAIAIIAGFALVRCFIAFSMDLGTDEAYYWLYSQHLRWNYFDHPPMVALWIRIFTANLALQNLEGFIRLGSVVGCTVASYLIYKTCETLHSPKAGLFGAVLYNASFYVSVTTGIFIMPDTPLMVFYTLSLWILARITNNEKDWMLWIAFGLTAGLCTMSKVSGAFLWVGVGLFALLKRREWLSQPRIYATFLLTVLISSPILVWNFSHDLLTFRFHVNRFSGIGSGFDFISFCREIINQVLYNNPFNAVAIVAALVIYFKKRKAAEPWRNALAIFHFVALPQIMLLLGISLSGHLTLPHWSGPAYVALIPTAAIYLTRQTKSRAKTILLTSLASLVVFLASWQYVIHYSFASISAEDVDKNSGDASGHIAMKLFSGFAHFQLIAETKNTWEPASDAFIKLYQQDTSSGIVERNAPLICYKWWGAQVEYYFCRPANIYVIGLGEANELHEYLFTNAERKDKVNFNTAYCIVPADDAYNVQEKFSGYYQNINKPLLITVTRKRKPAAIFYVYRLSGWKNRLPAMETGK